MGRRLRPVARDLRGAGRTLKLLDVTEFYSATGGGVRTYLEAKARWVADQPDLEHVIVVPSDRDNRETLHRSTLYRVKGPRAPASPGYHVLLGAKKVRHILARERPDLIELGSVYLAPWVARYAMRGTPSQLVAFFHMDLPGVVARALPRPVRGLARPTQRVLRAYLRRAYAPCRYVIAASASAARAAEDASLPVRRIPLGVDVETFHPDRRDAAWRPAREEATPVGLYVGRFATEKGLETILEGLPALHGRTGAHLVMVGEGHLRPRLEAFAATHPSMLSVHPYHTDRAALARAFASADFYVAPFPHETFGLAIAEAMASGLPVVGVASAGAGDILDGATWARTYGAGDTEAFVRAAAELLDGDLHALGRAARAVAVDRYSWEGTFETMFALYRAIARGDQPS